MFTELPGSTALLVSKGVYKTVPLFDLGGALFARHGSGYIRLYATRATSVPPIHVLALHHDGTLFADRFQRLRTVARKGDIPVNPEIFAGQLE